MRIVVFGASGGVGHHAARIAASRGHTVVAAARTALAERNVSPLAVDVRDADAVADAVRGAQAVLWCVGVTKQSGGDVGRASMPALVEALRENDIQRIVTVSGAGVTVPGDRKGLGARAISALTARLARDLVEDKAGEHAVLAASTLQYTELRPPRLVDRAGTGRYELGEQAPGLTAAPVAKADVALAMVDLAENDAWSRSSPFVTAAR